MVIFGATVDLAKLETSRRWLVQRGVLNVLVIGVTKSGQDSVQMTRRQHLSHRREDDAACTPSHTERPPFAPVPAPNRGQRSRRKPRAADGPAVDSQDPAAPVAASSASLRRPKPMRTHHPWR